MSAIFGLLYRNRRPADVADLRRMSERLRHRGPDASGLWNDGPVGLGQRALHTTPESLAEGGPIVCPSDRILVADARIDNRTDLIGALGIERPESDIQDGELILAAYRKWGRAAPERLLGDFAFAIWDAPRGVLFCARDPMGVKPFFYHLSDRLFAFASEIKGLLCLPEIPRALDEVQVGYFLDWFRGDRERTFHRGILRLPAAGWLEIGREGVARGTYWAADPSREVQHSSDEEYAAEFRSHFLEAVRCRLRSAYPVGSALSGGLDSASIVCAARDLLDEGRPLHTVSAVFPGLPGSYVELNDESRYIETVTNRDGIVSHRVRADEIDMFAYLDRMFWYHDAPPFGFMYWMRWAVYEAAGRDGIRVLFSGDDGDSVVSHGFERFNDLAREGRWRTAIDELEALGRRTGRSPARLARAYLIPCLQALARSHRWRLWREGSREIAAGFGVSPARLMIRSAADAFVPRPLASFARRLRGDGDAPPLLSRDFASRIDLEARERELSTALEDPLPSGRQSHALVLPSPMLQHIMEVTDSMGSAFSIETRCPFLDRRLVEFSLAVPPEQKLADGWTRLILRRAMEGILPPEIQWRVHKADLAYNFVHRLRGADRPALLESLFDEPDVLADYLDMDELRNIQRRFDSNGLDGARDASGRLYVAAVLARWLRGAHCESRLEPLGAPA